MKKNIAILLVVTALLLGSCASAPLMGQSDSYRGEPSYEPAPAAPMEMEAMAEYQYAMGSSASPVPDVERIVIKNAEMVLVVPDPAVSLDTISRMADQMGGFVVYAQLYQRTLDTGIEVPQAYLTIRVPADRLDEAMERIKSESNRDPVRTNINSQDVTREYVDLQSRLRNLEAAETQLQSIMEDARRTEDVLQVYSELTRVREQIEVIKGQIQYYDQASTFSSIQIELIANEAMLPITIGSWEPREEARIAIQSLVNSLKVVAKIGIQFALYVLPMLIVLALPVIVVVLVIRRVRRRRKGPVQPAGA
jgi:hypothetical protein